MTVELSPPVTPSRSWTGSVLPPLLLGALVVATLESIDAVVAWGIVHHSPPLSIFQGVAGGLLGRDVFRGGWRMALLGGVLHYFISLAVVTFYYLISKRLDLLVRRAVPMGLLYGAGVYLVMSRVVVPLSALGGGAPFNWPLFWNGLLGHPLLVGLPAALAARAAHVRRGGATPG